METEANSKPAIAVALAVMDGSSLTRAIEKRRDNDKLPRVVAISEELDSNQSNLPPQSSLPRKGRSNNGKDLNKASKSIKMGAIKFTGTVTRA